MSMIFCFFFFSSRRRHTRYWRDWSSDVCSSDLKNLVGIPIVYVTAEKSGRTQGPAVMALLKQAGCDAEDLQLKDRGIFGNGHFMMLENNRRQVFDVIRAWIEQKIPARS